MSQLLTVEGMVCENCAETVESALSAVTDAGYEAEVTSSREMPTP